MTYTLYRRKGLRVATVQTDRFTVTLPTMDEREEIAAFVEGLEGKQDIHGVKSLATKLTKYLTYRELADRFWHGAVKSASVVNGHRTRAQKGADTQRSKISAAQRFYESLSTPALRRHAAMYGIDHDAYDDQNDVIAAVVEKHVAEML